MLVLLIGTHSGRNSFQTATCTGRALFSTWPARMEVSPWEHPRRFCKCVFSVYSLTITRSCAHARCFQGAQTRLGFDLLGVGTSGSHMFTPRMHACLCNAHQCLLIRSLAHSLRGACTCSPLSIIIIVIEYYYHWVLLSLSIMIINNINIIIHLLASEYYHYYHWVLLSFSIIIIH